MGSNPIPSAIPYTQRHRVNNPMTMARYFIWTIGCQMNKADSERLESALGQLGLAATEDPAQADVIVVNSCVVRQSAEDRAVGMLSSLRSLKHQRQDRVVALMGCMVGPDRDGLQERFPHIDLFLRPQEYHPLLDLLGSRLGIDAEGCVGPLVPPRPSVTCYVPIIHGCDKFCSFCVIPYRRGREVSRPIPDIVREVEMLSLRGVKEVILLGQNVDSFGHDLPGSPDLSDLLHAVHDVDGIQRIRFLTSHPNDMGDRIIGAVAELPKVCENINIPFQAGDDEVLGHMRRGYTNADYRRLIERMRHRIPGLALVTDLIVGFPGETEEQFQRTCEMVRDIHFDKVHTAAYSPRPNTIAWRKMPDDVPQKEKKRRLQAIEELQAQVSAEINASYLGSTYEVLVDGHQRGRWTGRTRTDKLVYIDSQENLLGQMVMVKIEATSPWSLQGSVVAREPSRTAGAPR